MKNLPHIGIIMRTRNSGDILEQTLQALFSQTIKDFDLLVVDSGSTDNTVEIIRRYPARLISIPPEEYFPGKVLNAAIPQVKGDIIVFCNSDAVLQDPDTLEKLLLPFQRAEVMATFARQIVRPEAETWVRRDYQVAFPKEGDTPSWMTMSLCLAAMRRSAWLQRPFYTKAWGSEDTEWGHWARSQGHPVVYVSEAICMHSHNYTLRQLYGRRYIEGEADAFIWSKAYGIPAMLRDMMKALGRDLRYAAEVGDYWAMFKDPALRWVYYWAYYKGHQWGTERQQCANDDPAKGQNQVLKRYDK